MLAADKFNFDQYEGLHGLVAALVADPSQGKTIVIESCGFLIVPLKVPRGVTLPDPRRKYSCGFIALRGSQDAGMEV